MVVPVAAMGRTVRQRVIDALHVKLTAMTDGGIPVWKAVFTGDIEYIDNMACPAVSLDEGDEEKITEFGGCTEYNLPVFVHFRFRPDRGLEELDIYKYYLGLTQFSILADHTLGGLTINVEEDSNAPSFLSGVANDDIFPTGSLSLVITYRTKLHNPYKLISE